MDMDEVTDDIRQNIEWQSVSKVRTCTSISNAASAKVPVTSCALSGSKRTGKEKQIARAGSEIEPWVVIISTCLGRSPGVVNVRGSAASNLWLQETQLKDE